MDAVRWGTDGCDVEGWSKESWSLALHRCVNRVAFRFVREIQAYSDAGRAGAAGRSARQATTGKESNGAPRQRSDFL